MARSFEMNMNNACENHGVCGYVHPSYENTSRTQVETACAHMKSVSRTKLPNGRLSMLVDLGSRINIGHMCIPIARLLASGLDKSRRENLHELAFRFDKVYIGLIIVT